MSTHKGKVKWFNSTKGFGFIEPEDGGEDIFIHFSEIIMDGYKQLNEGQPVEYEMEQSDKGFKATDIKPLDIKSL